jgi:solute carrier family 35 protein E3
VSCEITNWRSRDIKYIDSDLKIICFSGWNLESYIDRPWKNLKMEKIAKPPSNLLITFGLTMNICCSITIIMINKWIYSHYKFPNICLTCIHFIVTSLGLFICRLFGLFKPASLSVLQVLPLALTFCGFVVFTNLSLGTNTVGTYQIIKTMTLPCIMIIQTQFYVKEFSTAIKLTMVV